MSKFKTRLKYYLVGFGLGLIFMFMIFGNRACSWLPENRVKNMLAEKEILVGDSVSFLMACQGVTNEDVYRYLKDDGDVDFSESETDVNPKKYWIKGKKEGNDLSIQYALYDEHVEVTGFKYSQHNCSSELSNEQKSVVPLPVSEVREIIESKEIRILEKARCEIKCLKLTKNQVEQFHHTGSVLMDISAPRATPNPHYWMEGEINGSTHRIKYIVGESRTRIAEIETNGTQCPCK